MRDNHVSGIGALNIVERANRHETMDQRLDFLMMGRILMGVKNLRLRRPQAFFRVLLGFKEKRPGGQCLLK